MVVSSGFLFSSSTQEAKTWKGWRVKAYDTHQIVSESMSRSCSAEKTTVSSLASCLYIHRVLLLPGEIEILVIHLFLCSPLPQEAQGSQN